MNQITPAEQFNNLHQDLQNNGDLKACIENFETLPVMLSKPTNSKTLTQKKGTIGGNHKLGSKTSTLSWRGKLCKLKQDVSCRFLNKSFRQFDCPESSETQGNNRTVRFNLSSNQVHEYHDYEDTTVALEELWWTSEELKSSKYEDMFALASEDDVQQYLMTFEQAYKEIHQDRMVPAETFKYLVMSFSKGYRGLESIKSDRFKFRKQVKNNYVFSVVNFYQKRSSKYEKTSKSTTTTMDLSSTQTQLDRSVQKYATKLSSGNRHFAQMLGKAQHLAVIRDDTTISGDWIDSTINTPTRRRRDSM